MSSVDFENSVVLVEEVLKKSPVENTEIVYLNSNDGKRLGPYIRKVFDCDCGLGNVYKTLYNDLGQQSDNIANVYSVFEKENQLYVFEEYIVGQTLDSYIAKTNFNINIISKLFVQLCNAINFLHTNFSSPIIHRDIKPTNILITESGQIKLIDFGIARNYENSDNPDTHKFGTVGYAPPEQFGYKQTDVRSDIYSLGKVLEFLCNKSKWAGYDSKINDSIFNEVIHKACEFDPNYRYKNVRQLISDFNRVEKTSSNKPLIVLGHIWNILLLLIVAFLICVAFVTITDPNNANSQMPIISKAIFCFILICFILIPFGFVFSYKPSIRKLFKNLPYFKVRHYIVFILACITGSTIFAIIAQIFT